jgi:hypothetical protein
MNSQALPRLTNRDKIVEMVDPAMKDQYSKKDLIQVTFQFYTISIWMYP